MNLVEIICFSLYLILGFMSWLALTCFLHDENKKLNGSWTLAMIFGLFASIVWPVSMWALYIHRVREDKNGAKA